MPLTKEVLMFVYISSMSLFPGNRCKAAALLPSQFLTINHKADPRLPPEGLIHL